MIYVKGCSSCVLFQEFYGFKSNIQVFTPFQVYFCGCCEGMFQSQCFVCVCMRGCAKSLQLCLFVTLWSVAHQAPLSKRFSRRDDWSALSFPRQGIFMVQGLNPCLLCLLYWQVGSLPLVPVGKLSSFLSTLLGRLSFLHCIFLPLLSQTDQRCLGYLGALYSVPLIYVSGFLPVSYYLATIAMQYNLKSRSVITQAYLFP